MKKINLLFIAPITTILFSIILASPIDSSTTARLINIVFGISGLTTFLLAISAFFFGWKLRKNSNYAGYTYGPWLLLVIIITIEAINKVLEGGGIGLMPDVIIFSIIAIIGICAKKQLAIEQSTQNTTQKSL